MEENMSRILVSIAALGLLGVATLPLQANAAERQDGAKNANQATDVSSQRHWRGRHYGGYRHYGARRYYGPRYGYYGGPARITATATVRRLLQPGIGVGIGPFGFRVF